MRPSLVVKINIDPLLHEDVPPICANFLPVSINLLCIVVKVTAIVHCFRFLSGAKYKYTTHMLVRPETVCALA